MAASIWVLSATDSLYAFDAVSGAAIEGFPIAAGDSIQSTAALVGAQVFYGLRTITTCMACTDQTALACRVFRLRPAGLTLDSSPATDGAR